MYSEWQLCIHELHPASGGHGDEDRVWQARRGGAASIGADKMTTPRPACTRRKIVLVARHPLVGVPASGRASSGEVSSGRQACGRAYGGLATAA